MINVIPKPNYINIKDGCFIFNEATSINICNEFINVAALARELLNLADLSQNNQNAIILKKDYFLENEEYHLIIEKDTIIIKSSSVSGALYGFVTLKQMLYDNKVICAEIKDKPLFKYRGFMLDVARHFFSKDSLKQIIDMLLLHKINHLHLHLSDDQAFRLKLEKFPELEKASVRKHTNLGDFIFPNRDYKEHKGIYTKQDIRELVLYAKERNIEIIPETDMPGHTTAILSVFPHLSCTGKKVNVCNWATITKLIMCGGDERVYEFAKGIVDELIEWFPSKYIHLGGDECSKHYWDKCEKCQKKIQENNLRDSEDLQAFFFNYLSDYLKSKGRVAIGWNECLKGRLDKSVVAQYWTYKDDENIEKHLQGGGSVILSRSSEYYFNSDYVQLTAKDVYNAVRTLGEKYNLLGLESCLWTEWTDNMDILEYRLYPRLTAFSEVCWSEKRDFEDFRKRYEVFKKIFDIKGMNYCINPFLKTSKIKKAISELKTLLNNKNSEVYIFSKKKARRDTDIKQKQQKVKCD